MPGRLALSGGPAWALIGVGASLLTLSGFLGWQLLETREELGNCRGKIDAADQSAAINAEAVDKVRDRLVMCLDEHTADLLAQAEADAEYNRRIRALSATVAQERAARDRLYETDEDCARWRACRVCDPIAERLRDAAGTKDDSG